MQTAKDKKNMVKPTKTEAKSAFQEIYYGSQRTTLNQFFDEMLKNKIERFSKKLGLLETNTPNKDEQLGNQKDFKPFHEKEIFIERDENAIINFNVGLSTDTSIENTSKENVIYPSLQSFGNTPRSPRLVDIENENDVSKDTFMQGLDTILEKDPSSANSTYKRNPKMNAGLILFPEDESSNTAEQNPTKSSNLSAQENHSDYETKSLNDIPNTYEKYDAYEKYDDDELLRMFSGNNNEEVDKPNEHLVNETNHNGMYLDISNSTSCPISKLVMFMEYSDFTNLVYYLVNY